MHEKPTTAFLTDLPWFQRLSSYPRACLLKGFLSDLPFLSTSEARLTPFSKTGASPRRPSPMQTKGRPAIKALTSGSSLNRLPTPHRPSGSSFPCLRPSAPSIDVPSSDLLPPLSTAGCPSHAYLVPDDRGELVRQRLLVPRVAGVELHHVVPELLGNERRRRGLAHAGRARQESRSGPRIVRTLRSIPVRLSRRESVRSRCSHPRAMARSAWVSAASDPDSLAHVPTGLRNRRHDYDRAGL